MSAIASLQQTAMTGWPSSIRAIGAVLEFARGVGLGVQVGDLLHLQRALEGHGVVRVAPDEKQGAAGIAARHGGQLPVHVDGLLDAPRQLHELVHERLIARLVDAAEFVGGVEGEEVQHRQLRGVALGRGDRDLRPRPGVERVVGELGDRAAHDVHDAQHGSPAGLALLERGDGVGGLARLGDHQHQRVLVDHGVGVAQLAGQLHLHGDAAEPLDGVAARAARVIGRAAGRDDDLVDAPELLGRP